MIQFTTSIKQFKQQGEKTGWTYIQIPPKIAEQLSPGNKKGFRVKGKLDDYAIKATAVMPMGDGSFILPLNANIRKQIRKTKGASLEVKLDLDKSKPKLSSELLECLNDEPRALEVFNSYTPSHKLYFSNWITSAKTEATKTKRIAQAVNALSKGFDFGLMLRTLRDERNELMG